MKQVRADGHLPISEREIVVQQHLSLPSTQLLARHVVAGSKHPLPAMVFEALEQTSGQGRRGKTWASPPGGSYQTIVLQDLEQRLRTGSLTLLIASFIAKAIAQRFDVDVQVKWPNDLFVYGQKIGGILTEWTKGHLLVGVGINACVACGQGGTLGVAPEQLPVVTRVVRKAVLEATARAWNGDGFRAADLEGIDFLTGRHVVANLFQLGSGVLRGVAHGVDDSGRLLVTDVSGTEHRLLNASIVQY